MQLLADITSTSTPVSGVMFADALEFFVFLIIAGISAVFQWFKNRGQTDDWSEQEKPRQPGAPPPPARPRKSNDWEEELRRMLEESAPTHPRPAAPPVTPPPRVPSPAPPPIPRTPPPLPQPTTPPVVAAPKVFGLPKVYKGHCEHCDGHIEFPSNMLGDSIVCPHCTKRTVLEPFIPTRVEQLRHKPELASFKESAAAYQKASNLDESVAARLHAVTTHPVESTKTVSSKRRAPEVEQVISLLRNPQTARQAVVASLILSQPKALES